MNQLLNMIMFLKELIFGRVRTSQLTKKQIVRNLILIGVLAFSLYGNYVLVKSLYKSSAKYVNVREELDQCRLAAVELQALRKQVTYYEALLFQNTHPDRKPIPIPIVTNIPNTLAPRDDPDTTPLPKVTE